MREVPHCLSGSGLQLLLLLLHYCRYELVSNSHTPRPYILLLHTFFRPLPVLSNNFSGLRLLELLILLYISQLPSPHLNNIHLVTKHRSNPHRRSLASYSIPLCVYSYTRGKLPSSYLLQPFLSSLSSSHLAHLLFIAIRPVLSFKHHPLFILKPRNHR